MEIKVAAATKLGHTPTKEELDRIGGLTAGVCYLPNTIEELFNEPAEKTLNRIKQTKTSGHTSPYEHGVISLELINIPKILAMYLNNEKQYTTSEKSARYKTMSLPEDEQKLYDKWKNVFVTLIKDEYGDSCPFFSDIKITKLAQENARYLTSVFTPTTMIYTVPYRQLNILYSLFKKESDILTNETDDFSKKLKIEIDNLIKGLEKLGYVDEDLFDIKNRKLSLIDRRVNRPIIKQYGDIYKVAYEGSFAQLAQAQRHRTIHYNFIMPTDEKKFYIPPILKNNDYFVKEWLKDCKSMADRFPQGMLVNVVETGNIDYLIMKAKERKCSAAQLEIDNQTTATIMEIHENLKKDNHPAAEDLEPYAIKGSRCQFPDFKCKAPCHFPEGVKGERII